MAKISVKILRIHRARPKVYWWWLIGYADQARLNEELVEVKNTGLGGVDIFEIGLTLASDPHKIIPARLAFMRNSSLKAIQFAVEEAMALNQKLYLLFWILPKQQTAVIVR